VTEDTQIEIGKNANVSGPYTTAIGVDSNALTTNSIAIGTSAYAQSTLTSQPAIAIGWLARCIIRSGIAIGTSASITSSASVAIGWAASSSSFYGVALGADSVASGANYAIAIGRTATASGDNGISIGRNSTASGASSVALGLSATTAGFTASVAIGVSATCTAANQIMLGRSNETVVCAGTGTALQVAGKIKVNGNVPTITAVTGTAPATVNWSAVGSCDTAGTWITGAVNASGAGAFTVTITFNSTFTNAPFVMVVPASSNITNMYVSTVTATTVIIGGNAVAASPLLFNYYVIGRY
jgi:hypothetical protein